MAMIDLEDQLPDMLQQPLTAMRLMVEGAVNGVVELDLLTLEKVRTCLCEMQTILDTVGGEPEG
jgi:hypothetical protein